MFHVKQSRTMILLPERLRGLPRGLRGMDLAETRSYPPFFDERWRPTSTPMGRARGLRGQGGTIRGRHGRGPPVPPWAGGGWERGAALPETGPPDGAGQKETRRAWGRVGRKETKRAWRGERTKRDDMASDHPVRNDTNGETSISHETQPPTGRATARNHRCSS